MIEGFAYSLLVRAPLADITNNFSDDRFAVDLHRFGRELDWEFGAVFAAMDGLEADAVFDAGQIVVDVLDDTWSTQLGSVDLQQFLVRIAVGGRGGCIGVDDSPFALTHEENDVLRVIGEQTIFSQLRFAFDQAVR